MSIYLKPLYQHMATAIDAMKRCKADVAAIKAGNGPHASFLPLREEWSTRWQDRLDAMLQALPHGSGLDTAWRYDLDKCSAECVVLTISYHNMDEQGGYCGWSDLVITIRPSLIHGTVLRITGGDSLLKDYLYDILTSALCEEHDQLEFCSDMSPEEIATFKATRNGVTTL
jgi:hypothetical protein